jgi:hypothetical protein
MQKFVYTLGESTETWGNGHTAMLLTITKTHTGETRTCDDFTYFEEGEDTQDALAELWEQMA